MRTTNLIQSYVSNTPTAQQYNSDKVSKTFDVHKELSNRTFIKPLKSNGKLLNPTLLDYPSMLKKDIKYDAKAFYHAIKGDANDHELGRLNDLGMKFGSLAIASYLFAQKGTPKTKIFEFIGLGTFFAAMDLWPKLFIQLPAKLIHGVNVRQEYEDSYGRKKQFYQDHQFIPWDLYSDEQIDKIGDRLNVPKDLPNRRDFTQEKMRKIALQNNTLWMLTAGFATPLMSALMCNALEKPVEKYLDRQTNEKADALLSNFAQEVKSYDFSKNTEALEELLSTNKEKTLTPELYKDIVENLTDGLDEVVSTGIRKDLAEVMNPSNKYQISDATVGQIHQAIKTVLEPANLSEKQLKSILPSQNVLSEEFSKRNLLNEATNDFSEHTKLINNILEDNLNKIAGDLDSRTLKKVNFLIDKLSQGENLKIEDVLSKIFKQKSAAVLTSEMCDTLIHASKTLNKFKAESTVLDRYAFMKVAQAPETALANEWNKVTETLFKSMNFTPAEIEKARLNNDMAAEVLRNKLEIITSDKELYGNFVSTMEDMLSTFHSKTSNIVSTTDEGNNLYRTLVNTTFDRTADSLMDKNLFNTAQSIVGFIDPNTKAKYASNTSAKHVMLKYVDDRIKGVKYSFYRLLNLADMYYRISHVEGIEHALRPEFSREVKEEIAELAKQSLLEGHTSDFIVKFWQKRNPHPNKSDYSQIQVQDGKVVNKYFGHHADSKLAELSNDRKFYEAVMQLMFGGNVHNATLDRLTDSVIIDDFKAYRNDVLNTMGGYKYFVKPRFLVGHERDTSSEAKFLLMGSTPSEMAFKTLNNTYNSAKWFKMFGKLGASLVGITLATQFFIGKMKTPQSYKEVK